MMPPADPPDDVEPLAEADPLALEALLRWYLAMGVDIAVGEAPQDRFAEVTPPRPAIREKTVAPAPNQVAVARAASHDSVEEAARNCATLEELRTAWSTMPGCGLAGTAAHMIFAAGRPGARLMIVGGAPDSDDERDGQAFSGAKGRLLDAMLRAIGLSRDDVYLANVIPWRPPGNRQPTPGELGFCMPFMRRHIELAAPELILCLGERAAQPLLATTDPVSRLRGRWMSYEGETRAVRTLVTFSLEYLLKQPLQKRRAWTDLLQVGANLRG